MPVGDVRSQALAEVTTNRFSHRIGSRKAVQLVIGDAEHRPAHGRQRVSPSRIPDAAEFAFVILLALILHVEPRFWPAEIAAKAFLPGNRARRRTCDHLVVHAGKAHAVTSAERTESQDKREFRLARRCGPVHEKWKDARDLLRTAERAVARYVVAQSPNACQRLDIVSNRSASTPRLIRPAQLPPQLKQRNLVADPRCHLNECKLRFAEEHVIAQSKERGTREAPRAHMRNAKLPRPTVRRAHQHVTRPFEPQTRMIPFYALKRRAELFGARGALGDAWFSAPHRS